jgi:hypothetical protein
MGDLTRNFSRAGFDVPEPYPRLYAGKLPALASLCQWVRELAGVPGVVTDTWRSPAHNAELVGAAPDSQHLIGEAADVVFSLVPIRTLASSALEHIASGAAPAFGQLIFYSVKGHVHISLPNVAKLGDRNGGVLVCVGADDAGLDVFVKLEAPAQLPWLSDAQKKKLAVLVVVIVALVWMLTNGRPSRRRLGF